MRDVIIEDERARVEAGALAEDVAEAAIQKGNGVDARHLPERRGHRLHARRRPELVRSQVRVGLQSGQRDRGGDRRRRAAHCGRGERSRSLLGVARWWWWLRHRHRTPPRAAADRRGIRGGNALPAEATADGLRALPRLGARGAGGGGQHGPDAQPAADPRYPRGDPGPEVACDHRGLDRQRGGGQEARRAAPRDRRAGDVHRRADAGAPA